MPPARGSRSNHQEDVTRRSPHRTTSPIGEVTDEHPLVVALNRFITAHPWLESDDGALTCEMLRNAVSTVIKYPDLSAAQSHLRSCVRDAARAVPREEPKVSEIEGLLRAI